MKIVFLNPLAAEEPICVTPTIAEVHGGISELLARVGGKAYTLRDHKYGAAHTSDKRQAIRNTTRYKIQKPKQIGMEDGLQRQELRRREAKT
jgi:hypothetical protein